MRIQQQPKTLLLSALAVMLILASVAGWGTRRHASLVDDFDLPAPQTLKDPMTLWATWYWTPSYTSRPGVPLLDVNEKPLGFTLPAEEFCHAAVQGAVRIDGHVFTFDDIGKRKLAPCERWRPDMPQAPYVRFSPSTSRFGEGVNGYDLVPYRTIAVDEEKIPIGTVLYIPAARGIPITLPDGRHLRHDGYFFAGDDGFGVDGLHIDVFSGVSDRNPFPWVGSRPWLTVRAYVVRDPSIIAHLTRLHRP